MTKEVILHNAKESLKLDFHLHNHAPKNDKEKVSTINGRKIATIVVLGAVTIVAATAAVVAAIFAKYILAAVLAATVLAALGTAIIASKIDISSELLNLISKMTDKIWFLQNANKAFENEKEL
ncbi:MAG: hypothetical protein HWD61_13400 [Parachlamydiaceae bacterium]|nr:MAG: hypothetical protein HWD61_13400 [Parachlamydiaceae bacterium]